MKKHYWVRWGRWVARLVRRCWRRVFLAIITLSVMAAALGAVPGADMDKRTNTARVRVSQARREGHSD